ncbi:MAG TPA: hypothetical protein VE178_04205 [Silvibacterium sp.]|jgi:hypothetical protein|nr:hypothetical protein [Silvibacterium sp.]
MTADPAQAASHANAARIGRWIIPAIPFGWRWVEGFGIQRSGENVTPSNVYLQEDELSVGSQLIFYIQAQIDVMKRTFKEPVIAGPAPSQFPGAQDCALLMLKHQPMNQMSVIQVQHYMRNDRWIGIVTLTTLQTELLKVRPDFEQFLKLLRIAPSEQPPL